MKKLLVFIGIFIGVRGVAAPVDTIPANNSLIEYTGRIDFTDPLAPKFSYSGVSIRACFTGTSIAAIFNDNVGKNYYNIILDGQVVDTFNISIGKRTYVLAEGLENKTHEIEIFKRTEQEFGKTQFFGFVVDKGANLASIVNVREKMIEFIGNSITCGYGNEGKNGEKFGPTTENHYLTYAAITSRNFNARHLAVCRSGIGIYRNYDGPKEGNAENMTNLYTRTYLYNEVPKYSFEKKPDLVCIDLGTNDFSTTGCDSARYVSNYFRLIDTIQTKYAMPEIICLAGPMMSGTDLARIKRYLTFIADSATKKGKGKVYFFEMSAQTGEVGIDWHPTVAQHRKNAQELTDFIAKLKGWKINLQVSSAKLIGAKHIELVFNTAVQNVSANGKEFIVSKSESTVTIDSVYLDPANKNMLHVTTEESFAVEEKIFLSYVPGSIVSVENVELKSFNQLSVQNDLTKTLLSKASTSADGKNVSLTFNKKLKKNTSIEALLLDNKTNSITIDSFRIFNTQLTIYLNQAIMKGDSIYVNYSGTGILGIDEVPLEPVSQFMLKNNSSYTDVKKLQNRDIEIYPNPSNSGIFKYSLKDHADNALLEVFNMSGKLLFKQSDLLAEGSIDLSSQAKGSFICRISHENFTIVRTIIIQ